ncbi:MAG: Gfo/Idh/MocA family protein [Phycisphaerales bacterium]
MTKNKLQIGIIGGGMIGNAHLTNFAKDNRVQVRWLAEIVPARAAEMKQKFNVPLVTTDPLGYRQMLADDDVDAVVICTPPYLHKPMALDVMKAGKNLLTEKPLGLNYAEAKVIAAAAAKHPKLKISGCSFRHARTTPKYAMVKRMIDDGMLGEVYSVHHRAISRQARPGIEYHPAAKWFLDRKLAGGGLFIDWGVYDFAFHLGVLGQPELSEVVHAFCRGGNDKVDPGTKVFTVEEHAAAMMRFGDVEYYTERAANAHYKCGNLTQILGNKGGLSFGYLAGNPPEVEFFYVDRDGKGKAKSKIYTVKPPKNYRGDMGELGRAYVDYLLDKRDCPMPLEIELKNMKVIDAIYRKAGWAISDL